MLPEPACYARRCKHFAGVAQDAEEEDSERSVCPAFPDGIPDDIVSGRDDHLTVRPGPHGRTVYEREEE
jgi:hypothetical protein